MKRKGLVTMCLLIAMVFVWEGKTYAAEFSFGPQIKIESVLTDRAYNNIYESFYHVTKNHGINGQEIADYACEFIGNPYIWGGTSLTKGADCSGFVQSVYHNFGIALPRTSLSQRGVGKMVEYEDALPGDIICYEGHVGIYIGNGKIVNARNPEEGIGITSATYAEILAVRRVI